MQSLKNLKVVTQQVLDFPWLLSCWLDWVRFLCSS